jgi:hypothetical protein
MSRWCPAVLLVVGLVLCLGTLADPHAIRYYVQLIRGVDDLRPPTPAAKPIGPRLSKCLSSLVRLPLEDLLGDRPAHGLD